MGNESEKRGREEIREIRARENRFGFGRERERENIERQRDGEREIDRVGEEREDENCVLQTTITASLYLNIHRHLNIVIEFGRNLSKQFVSNRIGEADLH